MENSFLFGGSYITAKGITIVMKKPGLVLHGNLGDQAINRAVDGQALLTAVKIDSGRIGVGGQGLLGVEMRWDSR